MRTGIHPSPPHESRFIPSVHRAVPPVPAGRRFRKVRGCQRIFRSLSGRPAEALGWGNDRTYDSALVGNGTGKFRTAVVGEATMSRREPRRRRPKRRIASRFSCIAPSDRSGPANGRAGSSAFGAGFSGISSPCLPRAANHFRPAAYLTQGIWLLPRSTGALRVSSLLHGQPLSAVVRCTKGRVSPWFSSIRSPSVAPVLRSSNC